jgi:peptidoglycan/xylan/chitin deacetylase (PgdA/CDA1 family)
MHAFRRPARARPQLAQYQPVLAAAPRWLDLPQRLVSDPGLLLEDFESASTWTVVSGNPPADNPLQFKSGAQSIKIDTLGGTNHTFEKSVAWDLSASQLMEIWVYWHGSGTAENFVLFLGGTATFTKYAQANISLRLPNAWNLVRLSRSDWTLSGGMTWETPVVKFRIRAFNNYGRNFAYSFDSLRGNVDGLPAAVLTFDDGLLGVYQHALEVLRSHNMVATSYPIGNQIGMANYMSAAQLQALQGAGWAIGNHGEAHPHYASLTQAQIEADLAGGAGDLAAAGVGALAGTHCAYPYGEYDSDVEAAMSALGYSSGRATGAAGGYAMPGLPWRWLNSTAINAATSLASAQAAVDSAKLRKEVIIFYLHNIIDGTPSGGDWSKANLDSLCAYLAAQEVPHLTIDELYRLDGAALRVRRPR